jgi:hypothetical protein
MIEPGTEIATVPLPQNDEEALQAIPPLALALAAAVGATVRLDKVVTLGEYRILGGVADELDELTMRPGLMSALILKSTLSGPNLASALQRLKAEVKTAPETDRIALFNAVAPLIRFQSANRERVAQDWGSALRIPPPLLEEALGQPVAGRMSRWLTSSLKLLSREEDSLKKTRVFAETFDDEKLKNLLRSLESGTPKRDDVSLRSELHAAATRALEKATVGLKSESELEQQMEVAERFLHTVEALVEQIRLRLQAVSDRLKFQSQMFREDRDAFVEKALDSVEIGMRDLMEERNNWTEQSIWEQFSNRGAAKEILTDFQPLKQRYERLFDQWESELKSFSKEAGVLRRGVLRNVDPNAFSALIPTEHRSATIKTSIDRAADTTLGVGLLGGIAAVGASLLGAGGAVAAIVTGPVGWVVGGGLALAFGWKAVTNPAARKRKLVKTKREALRTKLQELLKDEGVNHDEMVTQVMERFLEATRDQYAPLVVDARLAAMRSKLEAQLVRRVLADTQKFLEASAH